MAGLFVPQTERSKRGKVLVFIFGGREGEKKKNLLPVTQDPCVSAGILVVVIPWVHNSHNTFKQSYMAQKDNCRYGCSTPGKDYAPTPPISILRRLLGAGCHQSDNIL